VTLLNSSHYIFNSMLQHNQLIEGCGIFFIVENVGTIVHSNWSRIGKLPLHCISNFVSQEVYKVNLLSINTKLLDKV